MYFFNVKNGKLFFFINLMSFSAFSYGAAATFTLDDVTGTITNVLAGVLTIGIAALTVVGAIYGIRKFASAFR